MASLVIINSTETPAAARWQIVWNISLSVNHATATYTLFVALCNSAMMVFVDTVEVGGSLHESVYGKNL